MNTGDCWHYRPNGNKPVYCSSCTRKIRIIKNTITNHIKEVENEKIIKRFNIKPLM